MKYTEEEREEQVEESEKSFEELVEGEVERGDPVKVVMEDGKEYLTFYGWFPKYATYSPGGMMICAKRGEELIDMAGVTKVKSDRVEKIVPLEEV